MIESCVFFYFYLPFKYLFFSIQFCKANIPVSTVASAENKEPGGPSLGGNIPESQPPDGLLLAQNTNESLMSLASHPPAEPH